MREHKEHTMVLEHRDIYRKEANRLMKNRRLKKYCRQLSKVPEWDRISDRTMDHSAQNEREDDTEVIRAVTNYVLAPSLNAYVLWVLSEALQSGKKRLYFLARDGYFMYLYAKKYAEQYHLPIVCRYLYCSRYALRVPMYHLDMDQALSYITLGGLDVTPDKIMKRAALTEEQAVQVLHELQLPYKREEQIPGKKLRRVKKALAECGLFLNYVQEHSRAAMGELQSYIRQEGLLDDVPMAVVDSGWVGSMQKQLKECIRGTAGQNKNKCSIEGYYWGLYELPKGVEREKYHTYYFSPEGGMKQKVYFSNCLFEGIFSAPHGMTVGYKTERGRVKPKLAYIDRERKEFFELTQQFLCGYQDCFIKNMGGDFQKLLEACHPQKSREAVYGLMRLFMGKPTKKEAMVYGNLYFSDDVLEYAGKRMAEPMSERELRSNHLLARIWRERKKEPLPVKQSAWYEGSVSCCSAHTTYHRMAYAGYKYLLYYRQRNRWRRSNEY